MHPWNLASALAAPSSIKSGDTLWLTEGHYRGAFESRLTGEAGHPIIVRQYPGERATIDGTLVVRGAHAVYWDFEVMNSMVNRRSNEAGSDPASYKRRAGIDIHGSDTKFVNLVVHDAGGGFGLWSDAEGAEIYGCLIFANGWQGPDRGHGHGIYGQNRAGTQRISENVVFDQFGNGINLYGSDQAFLRNFALRGNVAFDNGTLSGDGAAIDILIGGASPAGEILVDSNFTYRSDGFLSARFGYDANVINDDLTLTNNYFAGQTELVNWTTVNALNNTFTGAQNLVQITAPPSVSIRSYRWEGNAYFPDKRRRALNSDMPIVAVENAVGTGYDPAAWTAATQHDVRGATAAAPVGAHVFVRPNQWQPGRAHIIVYNWSHAPSVSVNISSVLHRGDRYELRTVADYFGAPVAQGIIDSSTLVIPMDVRRAVKPIGSAAPAPPATGEEFAVFVLLRR